MIKITCYKCGEEGHISRECQSKTGRRAQPSNRNRRPEPHTNTICKIFTDKDSEEDYQVYTAALPRKVGHPKGSTKPYEKEKTRPTKQATTPSVKDVQFKEEIEQIIEANDDEMQDTTPARRLRKSKKYEVNVFDKMAEMPAPITLRQLWQVSPVARQQTREGLSKSVPTSEVVEVNKITETEEQTEEEDEHTSLTATCQVEETVVTAVVDTGSGVTIVSKPMVDRLEWEIEAATKRKFIVADGHKAVPLGRIFNVPIKFGPVTLPVHVLVVDTDSYDLVIGMDWLTKANATIDTNAMKMHIEIRGRRFEVPVNSRRGVRPKMESDEESEDEQILVVQHKRESRPYGMIKEEVTELHQYNEQGYHHLNTSEQNQLQEMCMHNRSCPYCKKSIYCAEHMCTCARTKMLERGEMFPPSIRITRGMPQETPGWKQNVPMFPPGPYNGQNPHPFREHTSEIWERFWETAPYIGKNRLQNPRWMYEDQPTANPRRRKCYWSDVDPHDLWHVLKRENENWRFEIDDTWRSQAKELEERSEEDPPKEYYPQLVLMMQSEETRTKRQMLEAKKLNPEASIPERKTNGSAGYDLASLEDIILKPGETTIVDTGLAVAIPQGYYGQIFPRSSMAMVGISTDGGVIDADYRGPVKVILINRHKWNTTTINKGDRIAQLIIIKVYTGPIQEVQELTTTTQGAKGFGSTEVNVVMENKRQETKSEDKHAYVLGDRLTDEQRNILRATMKK
jgi:deoxyuridine 5'-triphosphate nucleotidohydrolase